MSERLAEIRNRLPEAAGADFLFDVHLCFLCRDMDPDFFGETVSRLGLTRNERDFLTQFRARHERLVRRFSGIRDGLSPAEIYDMFHGWHFIAVVAAMAELGCRDEHRMRLCLEALVTYKRKWETLKLALNGDDLIALGVPQGRLVGQLLDELLHVKLVGRLPDWLDEVQYVKTFLKTRLKPDTPPAPTPCADS